MKSSFSLEDRTHWLTCSERALTGGFANRYVPSSAEDEEAAHNNEHFRRQSLANIAAARKVNLTEVESTVEGDIDLLGILGLDESVRNGYSQIRVHFTVEGDASPEQLAELVEQSRRRSAVWDVLSNGTDVRVDVSTP